MCPISHRDDSQGPKGSVHQKFRLYNSVYLHNLTLKILIKLWNKELNDKRTLSRYITLSHGLMLVMLSWTIDFDLLVSLLTPKSRIHMRHRVVFRCKIEYMRQNLAHSWLKEERFLCHHCESNPGSPKCKTIAPTTALWDGVGNFYSTL